MIIRSLELQNFRNYENAHIEFSEGVNIFYGDNAQGKTNILEGIWLFSSFKSFRGSEDKDFIKSGCE